MNVTSKASDLLVMVGTCPAVQRTAYHEELERAAAGMEASQHGSSIQQPVSPTSNQLAGTDLEMVQPARNCNEIEGLKHLLTGGIGQKMLACILPQALHR